MKLIDDAIEVSKEKTKLQNLLEKSQLSFNQIQHQVVCVLLCNGYGWGIWGNLCLCFVFLDEIERSANGIFEN